MLYWKHFVALLCFADHSPYPYIAVVTLVPLSWNGPSWESSSECSTWYGTHCKEFKSQFPGALVNFPVDVWQVLRWAKPIFCLYGVVCSSKKKQNILKSSEGSDS